MVKAIVIAGTSSGVGKTTVATGLTAALARRGYRVRTFKVGPDYIDPSYLATASGSPCRNLDTWLLPKSAVLELFHRAARGMDIAVLEGVMGLFDGHSPDGEAGSTAEVAKLLGVPVVLVADASKVGRSIAATVMGFKQFDPRLRIAGVVLNGVAGEGHLYHVKGPVEISAGIPVLGYMPHLSDLRLPERHLGLVPTAEAPVTSKFLERLACQVEQTLNLDRLLALAEHPSAGQGGAQALFPAEPLPRKVSVALARDAAFNFYYQDSLDLLEAWGAELLPFSPLGDSRLPEGVSGVYTGGGFPELFAPELEANEAVKASLRQAAVRGMPIYGECGGLMYLGRSLTDAEGRKHRMTGLVPADSTMAGARLTIGYRTVTALSDGPFLKRGDSVRGHEFHWSSLLDGPQKGQAAYSVAERGGQVEGFRCAPVLASYVHVHLGSKAGLARAFVETCHQWAQRAR